MSVFQYLETIAFKLGIAVEKKCLEGVDWYLVPPFVFFLVGLFEKVQVRLDGSAGKYDLFVFARREAGRKVPEGHEKWRGG
jgi:hypothetical protein